MNCDPPAWGRHMPGLFGRPAPGAARIFRAPGRQEVGDIGRRAFVADEVADEAARKPASKPFSVSPCLPALRVNRPEARSPVRSLSDTPRTGRAAEDVGPYHPSCPDAARRAKYPRRPRRRAVKWWRLHAPDRQ